jgi:hypothetical protein
MTRQQFRILLILLIGLFPMEALAQPVITIAPQAVGGLSSWTSTQPFNTPLTPYFAWQAGIEGCLWEITGDRNLGLTLGIGYDSRLQGQLVT